jgi:hypothetical protein
VRRSTGSGAAASGGFSFQHRVGAYYGALILAGEVRVPGLGTDNDRHQTAVQTFRSLPLDRPMQLALFDGPSRRRLPQSSLVPAA